jgi:Zn-dependent peptidase ImmA (M78 family)
MSKTLPVIYGPGIPLTLIYSIKGSIKHKNAFCYLKLLILPIIIMNENKKIEDAKWPVKT